MRHFVISLLVFLVGLARMPTGVEAQGFSRERFSINLFLPRGYCALDPAHPVDAGVINLWQQTFAARQQLAAAAVECNRLSAWRTPPLLLTDFGQYLVVYEPQHEAAPYAQRVGWPAAICRAARQQAGQSVVEPRSGVERRLTAVLPALKVGESKVVGVIDEEPAACYAVVVARAQMSWGEPASVVHVRATAVIKGRVLQFYQTAHTAADKEVAALNRSADLLKETIRSHLAANQ